MKNTSPSATASTRSTMPSTGPASPGTAWNTPRDTPSTSIECLNESVEGRIATLRETAERLEATARNLHDRLESVMVPMETPEPTNVLTKPQPTRCAVSESIARITQALESTHSLLTQILHNTDL